MADLGIARLNKDADANGTLTKNSGATLADRVSAGIYRIAFNTNITDCVYFATAGADAGSFIEDYHLYTSRTGTNTVNVDYTSLPGPNGRPHNPVIVSRCGRSLASMSSNAVASHVF